MTEFTEIVNRQVAWAKHHRLDPNASAYLSAFSQNLFAILSPSTEGNFRGGAGRELEDRLGEPAKMRALYFSSALVCNVFDYWRNADADAIGRCFAIAKPLTRIRFEAQLSSGLRGTPPALDLLLVATDDLAWGVESKFTEPYQGRQKHAPFVETYFKTEAGLWASLALPKCQHLTERLNRGIIEFAYLDAAQLLKHTLGPGVWRKLGTDDLYFFGSTRRPRKPNIFQERFAFFRRPSTLCSASELSLTKRSSRGANKNRWPIPFMSTICVDVILRPRNLV